MEGCRRRGGFIIVLQHLKCLFFCYKICKLNLIFNITKQTTPSAFRRHPSSGWEFISAVYKLYLAMIIIVVKCYFCGGSICILRFCIWCGFIKDCPEFICRHFKSFPLSGKIFSNLTWRFNQHIFNIVYINIAEIQCDRLINILHGRVIK